MGFYSRAYQGTPNSDIEKTQVALKQAGDKSEIVLYPDTPHAVFADCRPNYREEQARDGWTKLLAWFEKQGVT